MYTTKQIQTHRHREQTRRYQWREGKRKRQDRYVGLRDTNYYV